MRTFTYSPAGTSGDAVASHSRSGAASYLAGGTSLLDLAKIDVMRPDLVVDINRLPLKKIEKLSDGRLKIGALVTNTDLAQHPVVKSDYTTLSQAILSGASTQLRNKATTAGNIMQRVRCSYFRDGVSACNKREPGSGCAAIGGLNRSVHAVLGVSDNCIATHPSDMCVAMAAIGARILVEGPEGQREIDFLDFHLLPGDTPDREHALKPDELITHVILDAPIGGSRSSYLKLRDRTSYQFSLASSAAIVVLDGNIITNARLALGGVSTKPWRAKEAEMALVGQVAGPSAFAQAAEITMKDAKPQGHNAYKVPLGKQAIIRNLRNLTA